MAAARGIRIRKEAWDILHPRWCGVEAGPKPARSSVALIARIAAGALAFRRGVGRPRVSLPTSCSRCISRSSFRACSDRSARSGIRSPATTAAGTTRSRGTATLRRRRTVGRRRQAGQDRVFPGVSAADALRGRAVRAPPRRRVLRRHSRRRGSRSCWPWCCCSRSRCSTWHEEQAERAVLLAAIFPFAFFFGVVYTESDVPAARARWPSTCSARGGGFWAACSARLATATRVNGILILPALAWIAWRRAEPNTQRSAARGAAGLVLVACGIGAYFAVRLHARPDNPFEWASAIRRWGYYPGGAPWLALVRLVARTGHASARVPDQRAVAPYDTLNGLTGHRCSSRRSRSSGGASARRTACSCSPTSGCRCRPGMFEGMGRYCAVLFPFFILAAGIRWRRRGSSRCSRFRRCSIRICLALFTTIHPIF